MLAALPPVQRIFVARRSVILLRRRLIFSSGERADFNCSDCSYSSSFANGFQNLLFAAEMNLIDASAGYYAGSGRSAAANIRLHWRGGEAAASSSSFENKLEAKRAAAS